MNTSGWKIAFEELSRRKLRTFLTLLGMIFGTAAIVAMQGIGEGSKREALRLVQSLGLNNIIIEAHPPSSAQLTELRQRSPGLSIADGADAVESTPGAQDFGALKMIRTWAVVGNNDAPNVVLYGVTENYFHIASLQIETGRTFREEEERNYAPVAVLGYQAARTLFPGENAIGKLIKVNQVTLRIVGVLADRDLGATKFQGVALSADANAVFAPLSSALERFRLQPLEDEVDRIFVRVAEATQLEQQSDVIARRMATRHAGVSDYGLIVPQRLYAQSQETQRIFNLVVGSIAAISLLVGGIGIMNIMLANVFERQREIGLLRAIGAKKADIILQFLQETVVISTAGSMLGLTLGIILSYTIAAVAKWNIGWSIPALVASCVACAGIGIFFGVYPARQAARLDPIEAIRSST